MNDRVLRYPTLTLHRQLNIDTYSGIGTSYICEVMATAYRACNSEYGEYIDPNSMLSEPAIAIDN